MVFQAKIEAKNCSIEFPPCCRLTMTSSSTAMLMLACSTSADISQTLSHFQDGNKISSFQLVLLTKGQRGFVFLLCLRLCLSAGSVTRRLPLPPRPKSHRPTGAARRGRGRHQVRRRARARASIGRMSNRRRRERSRRRSSSHCRGPQRDGGTLRRRS